MALVFCLIVYVHNRQMEPRLAGYNVAGTSCERSPGTVKVKWEVVYIYGSPPGTYFKSGDR